MAKTPSKKSAKAVKAASGEGDKKKKRRATRHESYGIYIYKARGGGRGACGGGHGEAGGRAVGERSCVSTRPNPIPSPPPSSECRC